MATPARVYDFRPGTAPAVGPKTPLSAARTLDLKANGSGVPARATAVTANLLLVDATRATATSPSGPTGRPTETLVWGGTAGRFSTLAVTPVDAQARCQLDIVGYYR